MHCEAHNSLPSANPSEVCNGALFQCANCRRHVCAGYGGCDDLCDRCFSGSVARAVLRHIRPTDPANVYHDINAAIRNIVDEATLIP